MITVEDLRGVKLDFSGVPETHRELRIQQLARVSNGEKKIAGPFLAWVAQSVSSGQVKAASAEFVRKCAGVDASGKKDGGNPETDWDQKTRCANLGGVIDENRVCKMCGMRGVKYTVRACSVHGECSERLRDRKVANCLVCDDYRPASTGKASQIKLVSQGAFKKEPATKPSFLRTANGDPADYLQNHFRGAPIFLLCGGPSLAGMDLELLKSRGVMTAAVNNAGAFFPADIVFMVDSPIRFHEAIWQNPRQMKFTRVCVAKDEIRTRTADGKMIGTGKRANESPNAFFYRVGNFFTVKNYLEKSPPAWQCEWTVDGGKRHVKRSVMLVALRMLWWLGFRTVFLLGADFNYKKGATYAFPGCDKAAGPCGTNNTAMGVLREWFTVLNPEFKRRGYHVYNCTPNSKLTAFEQVDFAEAINVVEWAGPVDTTGYYGN